MTDRPPAIRKLVIFGALFIVLGTGMTIRGVIHTLSGEPIPATRYEKASTGPVDMLFGVIGIVLGGFVAWRGLRGKPWP